MVYYGLILRVLLQNMEWNDTLYVDVEILT